MKAEKRDDRLALLARTLDKLGVEIRRGAFDAEGGLVRLADQYVVFVPSTATAGRERELYLDALKKIGTQGVHVPPLVRRMLGDGGWDNAEGVDNEEY